MLYSMACVDACVSRGRADQSEKASLVALPNLIVTRGQIGQYRQRPVRTWTFGQATLTKYWMDKGRVENTQLVGTWKWVIEEVSMEDGGCRREPILTTSP